MLTVDTACERPAIASRHMSGKSAAGRSLLRRLPYGPASREDQHLWHEAITICRTRDAIRLVGDYSRADRVIGVRQRHDQMAAFARVAGARQHLGSICASPGR